MKNKSFRYHYPTFGDKFFDKNKDGELDRYETLFRDMQLDEIKRKSEERAAQDKGYNYRVKEDRSNFVYSGDTKSAIRVILSSIVITAGCILFIIILGEIHSLLFP